MVLWHLFPSQLFCAGGTDALVVAKFLFLPVMSTNLLGRRPFESLHPIQRLLPLTMRCHKWVIYLQVTRPHLRATFLLELGRHTCPRYQHQIHSSIPLHLPTSQSIGIPRLFSGSFNQNPIIGLAFVLWTLVLLYLYSGARERYPMFT